MSDYEGFEGAESELGNYEAVLEVSGYDAVTTTQQGLQQDEFLKDSGLTIDTVGDANKAVAKKEKKEKTQDFADAFENVRHHIDNHKYQMNIGGKDVEISHGDLKTFMQKQQEAVNKKMKGEKDPKKLAKMQQDQMMLGRMLQHMEKNGALTEAQQKEFTEHLENNPDVKAEFDAHLEGIAADSENQATVSALKSVQEEISPDVQKNDGELCLTSTFEQQSSEVVMCEVSDELEQDISNVTLSMSNNTSGAQSPEAANDVKMETSSNMSVKANFDF
jgi:hypothetical protein